jgi:hypothetical protein
VTELTVAEERGLLGLSLDSQVRRAFSALPPETMIDLVGRVREGARQRQLVYVRQGVSEVIPVMLRPFGIMPDQLAYLHFVSLTLINALKRLPDLYIQDFGVRSVVPLTPREEQWLWDTWGPSHRELNPVIGRMDGMLSFTSPTWKDTLTFVEPNLNGVGGLHLIPACEQMVAEVILPVVRGRGPELQLEPGQDMRHLFIQELLDHLEALGRPGRTVCFLEEKDSPDGPVEQQALADYYRTQYGLTILHADPSELRLEGEEVWCGGVPIDIAYRDYELRDIVALETEGRVDVRPLRQLFKSNRMVSSLAGEFDHKSCWEILTDPQFTQKYYNADERQVFRRHVLWTRLLRDRRTTLPDGETGDLLEYTRRSQEILVLKPNRSYGGDRVLLGNLLSAAEWETAVDHAVSGGEDWVVQRLAHVSVSEFPVVTDDGAVSVEPFYTVMGFAPTKFGMAILGRASQKAVVNVAQRGGLCAVLIGKPTGKLFGPARPA